MLSSSLRAACLACGAYVIVLTSVPAIWGQDTKPPAEAPKAEAAKTEPSPSDAKPEPPKVAEEPKAAPEPKAVPEPKPAAAPPPQAKPSGAAPAGLLPFDYTRLAHPAVADQLELTDEQRAAVVQLVNERAMQLASAKPEQRKAILDASDQKLAALLTQEQRAKLATLAGEQKLRFNFRFQKWDDVLDWFARQAGLALVMDQAPSGAFTYSDTRSYSPSEAIDLLNNVLLTKGFTLVQRGRMLILVDLSQDLPLNLIPRVPPDEIAQHGKSEIISVLFPLGRRPADMVEKEIKPLIGKYGSCVGLPQTGQLLVTETAGKLQAISILISSIPEPPAPKQPEKAKEKPAPPPPVLAVYPVTVIKPAAAVQTLSILFPNAKFTVDEKSDQIMAYATPNEQTAIKAAVDQMQANRPADQLPRLEVYRVDELPEADKLVEQLKVVIPDAQATFDKSLSQLLVFGDPKAQDTVKQMLQKLGASMESADRQVMVYQPKHFDPTALATLIKQLLPRADISTDAALRRVVVSTTPARQTMIKSLVDQLDQESALEDQPVLQVYTLDKPLDASVLPSLATIIPNAKVSMSTDGRQLMVVARVVDQTIIKKMVEQWKEAAKAQEEPALKIYPLEKMLTATDVTTIKTMVPGAQVTLSTDGHQLSVVAVTADQEAVKALVDELTTAASEQQKPALKIYPLANTFTAADVTNIQALVPGAKITLSTDGRQLNVVALSDEQQQVESLIKEMEDAAANQIKPQLAIYQLTRTFTPADVTNLQTLVPDAKITLSADGRQLNVLALDKQQTEIEKILKEMDDAAAKRIKPEMAVYPLVKPLSPTVMSTLQTLVPEATVSMSADGKQLIVVARTEDQAMIKKTLDQIAVSAGGTDGQRLEIYQVKGLSAAELQSLLQPLVIQSTITLDAPQDRLIIWGPESEQKSFADVVAKLDANPLVGTKPVLEFYPLEDQSLLAKFTSVLSTLAPGAKITWDDEGQRAMVVATPKEQQIVKETIQQIMQNAQPVEKQVLRLYTLTPTEQTRFEAVQADVLKDLPGMRVIKDPQTGELAIWGKASQHEKLAQILEQLKTKGESMDVPLLMAYPVNHGSGTAVQQMLQQLFPTSKITLDEKSDRVLVYAPLSIQGRIKQTMAQLQVEGVPNNREEIRTYSAGKVDPTPLLPLLQKLVPDMQLQVDAASRSVIASGTVRDQEVLEKAIQQFREGDPQQRPVIRAYPLEGRSTRSLFYMRGVLAEVVPDAVITIDPRGGSIVASASEADQAKLKQAIDEVVKLDRSTSMQLETYTLDKVTSSAAIGTLTQIVPDAQISAGVDPRQIVVWASAEDQQRVKVSLAKLEESAGAQTDRVLQLHRVRPTVSAQLAPFIARTLPDLQVLSGQGTDRILVWGTPKDQQRLAELIQRMDSELGLDKDREMKTYELGDVPPSEARRVLDSAIGNLEYVTGTATDRLVIWADEATHKEVAKLLEELKKAVTTPEQMIKVHRFEPEEMDVNTVYNALSPQDMKDLSIQVNAATNSLIVRGPANRQVELSETIANLMDQLPAAEKPTAEVYRLKHADPSAASIIIRSLLPSVPLAVDTTNRTLAATAVKKDQAKIKEVLDQLDSELGNGLSVETYIMKRANPSAVMAAIQPIVPGAKISADIYNKMLIVTATADEHKQIKAIVEQADLRGEGEQTTKAYPLKYANPYTIATALQTVVPNATVSADALNKMLIVTASAQDHERIQSVLEQADKRGGGDLETKAYVLHVANPSTIAAALTSVVPDAKVSPDVTNQMLIVTASKEDQARVQTIVDEADRKSEGEVTTKVYALNFANPSALSYSIKPIAPNATCSPDPTNKTLIVTATAKDHERIKAVIDQADKRGGGDLITTAYTLKWANPAILTTALAAVVPNATISSDVYNKMLIVTANKEDHEKIKAVIEQADNRGGGDLITRTYTLQTANPSTIMVALRPIVPDATISSDVTNRMLIVTASEEDHGKIAKIVEDADRRADGELVTQVYTLQWANPSALYSSLVPIVPNATISPDVYNKTLIVTGTAKDQARVKAVVDQADQRGGGELTTKAYPLKWAYPPTVATSLTTVVPDAKISPDPYNKMLIVTASEADHKRIQEVVDQVDQRGGGELTTKAYTLKWAYAPTVATALTTVVPDAKISPDPTNKMLIVTANAEDHKRIQEVIDQADQRGGGELTTKAFVLKWANPAIIATSLTTVVPDAKISSDVYNKMLLVTANEEDLKKIEAIIEQADTLGGGKLITKAYPLKWAYAPTVATSLTTAVPDAKVSADPYNKMLIVTANEEDHKRIQEVLDQADKRGGGEQTTKSYALKWANASTISTALATVVPDAKISPDPYNKMLIVTANEEDHKKIQEVLDEADKRGGGDLTTKTYSLRRANPSTIMQALTPILPDARISADPTNRLLIVTASEEDHARVKTIVDGADGRGEGQLVTEAYSLKWANPNTLVTALSPVVPNAVVSADATNKTLVVTASAEDQLLVKKVVEQADRRGDGEMTTEVYLLTRANPLSVQRALEPLVPDATIGSDATSKTLIVSAPATEQEKIKKIVERADRRGEGELITKVYPFKLASPTTAATALQTLIPNALLSPDVATNTLIVTGSAEDHKQVEPLVKELDVASPTTRVLKPYSVEHADPQQVYTALTQLFRTNRDVSVGFQEDTGMILVFATPVDQDEVAQAITDIDKATAARPKATMEVYSLEGLDGTAAIASLKTLLADETPKIELEMDDNNNQMLAIAEPAQHEMIRKALSQITPQQRDVEVFTLQRIDPYSADLAITTLFEDLPFAARPSVEADPDSQQLIVRATKKQLERVKELLEKMGEAAVEQNKQQQSTSMLRVIPLSGNVDSTLKEIQRIWPQVRGNEIQIVTPPRRRFQPAEEETPEPAKTDETREGAGTPQDQKPAPEKANQDARGSDQKEPTAPPEPPRSPEPAGATPGGKGAQLMGASVMFVSAQDPQSGSQVDPAVQEKEKSPPAPAGQTTPAPAGQTTPAPAGQTTPAPAGQTTTSPSAAKARSELPPIVVIASEGRLTIASRDTEALDQFEELMKTLQRGRRVAINNGNFSMFLLQNAAAKDVAATLNDLFSQGSRSSRRSEYGSYRRRSTNLTVVADERMNALLVYGNAADRAVVEQMLDVLDSVDIPDSLSSERPRMIPVKNLPARTILTVLTSVYKTQLSARRSLQPVTIPQGISPEMTAMLELLNATANSPILTLDADETTNSIVMRAPRQLGEEIEEFVKELDEQAKDGGKRNISLVPLKEMNSEQIQDALRLLMRGGRFRRGGYGG